MAAGQQLAEKAHVLLDLRSERMAPHGHALVMGQRAWAAVALGELAAARDHSNRSLELAVGSEDMPFVSGIVEPPTSACWAATRNTRP